MSSCGYEVKSAARVSASLGVRITIDITWDENRRGQRRRARNERVSDSRVQAALAVLIEGSFRLAKREIRLHE